MLRRLQVIVVMSVSAASIPAMAVEAEEVDLGASDASAAKDAPPASDAAAKKEKPTADEAASSANAQPSKEAEPASTPAERHAADAPAEAPEESNSLTSGWHLEAHGYFRAPLTLGLSHRTDPDNPTGSPSTQVSYGPNRTFDWSYYSFAYTRLQEQDWAELFFHAKKKHVDAALGWMGYWFQGIGFRNPDAAWTPALAYVTLDSDVDVGGMKPNVALTMGAFWPKYGYFEKYDTYTLGRFRQMGEELNLTLPFDTNTKLVLTEGFGAGRDGSYQGYQVGGAPPLYGAITSIDLVTWVNLRLIYQKYLDASLHYNTMWTAEPNLPTSQSADGSSGKSYGAAKNAHLSVIGAEAHLRAPYAGHLWLSPSYIHVRNGWALNNAGTEVMHSLGGGGISTNYMFWTNVPSDSTGTGSMTNFGFSYENSLSSLQGKAYGSMLPDVTFSLYGLYTKAKGELPATTTMTQSTLNQFKYGVDATLQATNWFGFMLRYDLVNMDMDHGGYIFSAISPRVTFQSHYLSSERLFIQFSHYTYGDHAVLAATWPWGTAVAAGSTVFQQNPAYINRYPDRNVLKLQAEIAF